ncbi:MAG: hypothetical protein A2Y15_08805 [Clostridiales bacterium GWF2_36_10]|nr:MAG: hypothetical protein A2Y15_08805 [Clostridiales bacterium GWF2_36_10]HAN20443.1 hypothetical protein [Clostridiales bacterium]
MQTKPLLIDKIVIFIDKYIVYLLMLEYLIACFIAHFVEENIDYRMNIGSLLIAIFARYMIYFMLWYQLKYTTNPKVYRDICFLFFVCFSFIGIIVFLYQLINGYQGSIQIFSIVMATSLLSGAIRFRVKNNELIN